MDESPPTISKKVQWEREFLVGPEREAWTCRIYSGHNRKSNDDWPLNQFFSVASYKTNQIEGVISRGESLKRLLAVTEMASLIASERNSFFRRESFFGFGRRKLMVWHQPSGLLLLVVVVVVWFPFHSYRVCYCCPRKPTGQRRNL